MSYLNLTFGILAYEDQQVTNPQIRTLDVNRTIQGVAVTNERTDKIEALQPGESKTVVTTARPIGGDATSELHIWQPIVAEQVFRLEWTGTGTAVAFRTRRAIGVDATTEITMTRVNAATVRITSTAGTLMATGAIQIGDWVQFERTNDVFTSLFNPVNQGQMFRVASVGTNHVEVIDNGAAALDVGIVLGGDFFAQMKVLAPGPVVVGDTIEIRGANPNNNGKFIVTTVSSNWIEFVSALSIDETFLGVSKAQVYDRLIGFLFVRANGPLSLKIDGQTPTTRLVRMNPAELIFIGTVQAYQVDVVNEGTDPVSATVFHASVPC